jgi:hypothetical protein
MTVEDILEALGGRHVVARLCGVSRHAPYNWRFDGIPSRHWPDLVALAQKSGVKGITFDVLRATGRAHRMARDGGVTEPESTHARKADTSGEFRGKRAA